MAFCVKYLEWVKKVFFIGFYVMVITSCGQSQQQKKDIPLEKDTFINADTLKTVQDQPETKVVIDYLKNKDLLDIILLLPDSSFSSWQWTIEDRKSWYNEIKSNNFYIDKDPFYFEQSYFKPGTAGFRIVDGFWTVSLFKAEDGSFIVITNDITGDWNEVNTYEVMNGEIKEYSNFYASYKDYVSKIKRDDVTTQQCAEKFKELEEPFLEYIFLDGKSIEIESSWYLVEKEYKNCLKGNAIVYEFDPEAKLFELKKIYWKPKSKDS